jgi:hypothetical protein
MTPPRVRIDDKALQILRDRKTAELSLELVDRDFRREFETDLARVLAANDGIGGLGPRNMGM